jgi:hypothetical protein
LYLTTKKRTCKFQQTHKPVKDKDDNSPSTEEQLKRRAEHFRELLNHCTPETQPDIPPAETELPIYCDKPSTAEISKTITTLKNSKARTGHHTSRSHQGRHKDHCHHPTQPL